MRRLVVVILVIALAATSAALPLVGVVTTHPDPCDGYGDCVSSFITYLRANPDNSLYLGDSFQISLGISYSANAVGSHTNWIYDSGAFSANMTGTQAEFRTLVNSSSGYGITAIVTFMVVICATSNGQTTCDTYYSSLATQQAVQTREFVLTFQPQLTNATTPLSQPRRNPDGSFYAFDAFRINYTYSFLFMQQRPDIKVNVTPTYDHPVLNLTAYSNRTSTGYFFFQMDNKTGSYATALTAKALSWLGQTMGLRTSSTPFNVIQLVIDFRTLMENVTATNSLVPGGKELLRNPDGSFFRNGSFAAGWNATFKFSDFRPDIRINVTSFNPAYLKTVGLVANRLGRNGTFTYRIGVNATYQPYSLVLRAEALNYYNDSLALTTSAQPYAVVRYHPYFTYFTYMMYNSKNSSTYERDFVTLARYGGNDPSYSYRGDINTAPITAQNDTRERALINNFTFSNDAWHVLFSPTAPNATDDLTFTNIGSANITVRPVNSTFSLITWANRVQKFYFFGRGFDNYTAEGTLYFNVTEHAFSKGFAGSTYPIFNTTYLYQPIYYNGYLVFQAYDNAGKPDPSVNMTGTLRNPFPIDKYLLSRVEGVFGNDSGVINAFKADLYTAYNTTQILRPVSVSNGTWTYLVNQTNIAFPNASLPYFTVTATGHQRTFTYSFNDSFSAFLLQNSTLPVLPFQNITAYYVDGPRESLGELLALPMLFGPSSESPFLVFASSGPVLSDPYSPSTAGYISVYGMIYGANRTIYANLDGGGVEVLGPSLSGLAYDATLIIPRQSGGVSVVWVKDPQGKTIVSELTQSTTSPPSPQGFFGVYPLSFLVDSNGTYTIGVTNSWGVSSAVYTTSYIYIPPAKPPTIPLFLEGLIAALVIGFYFLGRLTRKGR